MIEMKSLTVFYSSRKVLLNYSLIQLHKCHLSSELVLTLSVKEYNFNLHLGIFQHIEINET